MGPFHGPPPSRRLPLPLRGPTFCRCQRGWLCQLGSMTRSAFPPGAKPHPLAPPLPLPLLAVAVLAVIALPRLLHQKPVSFPLPLVGVGAIAFALPIGLADPDPVRYGAVVEHLSELVVVVGFRQASLIRPYAGDTRQTRRSAKSSPLVDAADSKRYPRRPRTTSCATSTTSTTTLVQLFRNSGVIA